MSNPTNEVEVLNSESYKGTIEENYRLVIKQLCSLLEGENDLIANLSNASALLIQFLNNVSWVGSYLFKSDELDQKYLEKFVKTLVKYI